MESSVCSLLSSRCLNYFSIRLKIHSLDVLPALVQFVLLMFRNAYGEPFYGSAGPEVQEASKATLLLSNIHLGYRGQAIRLST